MEIERKWLIKKENIPYDLSSLRSCRIDQRYVSFSPTIRIRSINGGEKYILTVKSKGGSEFSRFETESEITKAEYDSLLKKTEGNAVIKTRYFYDRADGLLEEIDIFEGGLSGLCYLEIEFPDEETCVSFPEPGWVTREVTGDGHFSNSGLAEHGMPAVDL